ncbi:MAG: O-antigen ligase family protein [Solirubrobacteraceae bacterium]
MIAATLPSAPVLAAACLGALVVIAALALLMRSDPRAFPVLAVLALPFRLPISADGRTVNLLLPLYAVVAAGALVHLLPRMFASSVRAGSERGAGDLDAASTVADEDRPAGWRAAVYERRHPAIALDWLLLAAVVLYALQSVYSADIGKAAENLAFFYVPFGLLYLLLRDAPWTRRLLLTCLGVAVVLALLFAGVGFIEYFRKALFLNPKVVAANEYDNYFRVNSLFFDPSIYGRFLALVMIAVTTAVLWARERREQLIGAGVLTWLLLGLITSFSQSSIAALLLGLAVLAAWRWDVRSTAYVALALAAIALVVVVAAPPSLHFGLKGSGGSANNATSGRTKLISGGLKLFADRPLQGFGSGSFETQYKRHGGGSAQNATSASHTIPITVAAEQGIVGVALYVALVVVALLTLFAGAGRSPPRIALAAGFAALVLHTWVYADFLEDPITWTLLGVGVALSLARISAPAEDELACATT